MTDPVAISIPNGAHSDSTVAESEDLVDGRNNHHHNTHRNHNHSEENERNDRVHHNNSNNRTHHNEKPPTRSSHSPTNRARRDVGQVADNNGELAVNIHDVDPLLVNNNGRRNPGHELDEDEGDDEDYSPNSGSPNPGVDDGFFVDVGTRADTDGSDVEKRPSDDDEKRNHDPYPPREFPAYNPDFNPNVMVDANGRPQVIPDINVYQQKKNLAQGMMDLALLSANANQLRYILESYSRHPYYWFSLISISLSIILQVAVGVGLIMNSRYNVKNKQDICRADKINNFTIVGIFLITIVNVFISAFGVADAKD